MSKLVNLIFWELWFEKLENCLEIWCLFIVHTSHPLLWRNRILTTVIVIVCVRTIHSCYGVILMKATKRKGTLKWPLWCCSHQSTAPAFPLGGHPGGWTPILEPLPHFYNPQLQGGWLGSNNPMKRKNVMSMVVRLWVLVHSGQLNEEKMLSVKLRQGLACFRCWCWL